MTHGRDVPPVDRAHPLVQRDNILPRNEKKIKGRKLRTRQKKKKDEEPGKLTRQGLGCALDPNRGGENAQLGDKNANE